MLTKKERVKYLRDTLLSSTSGYPYYDTIREVFDFYLNSTSKPTLKLDNPERIMVAAIHYDDGVTYDFQPVNIESGFVFTGVSHGSCLNLMKHFYKGLAPTILKSDLRVQGFLTNRNRFVGREEAAKIAYASKQIKTMKNKLYSEDLF